MPANSNTTQDDIIMTNPGIEIYVTRDVTVRHRHYPAGWMGELPDTVAHQICDVLKAGRRVEVDYT